MDYTAQTIDSVNHFFVLTLRKKYYKVEVTYLKNINYLTTQRILSIQDLQKNNL
jgi:hypothetical protein